MQQAYSRLHIVDARGIAIQFIWTLSERLHLNKKKKKAEKGKNEMMFLLKVYSSIEKEKLEYFFSCMK